MLDNARPTFRSRRPSPASVSSAFRNAPTFSDTNVALHATVVKAVSDVFRGHTFPFAANPFSGFVRAVARALPIAVAATAFKT